MLLLFLKSDNEDSYKRKKEETTYADFPAKIDNFSTLIKLEQHSITSSQGDIWPHEDDEMAWYNSINILVSKLVSYSFAICQTGNNTINDAVVV